MVSLYIFQVKNKLSLVCYKITKGAAPQRVIALRFYIYSTTAAYYLGDPFIFTMEKDVTSQIIYYHTLFNNKRKSIISDVFRG